MQVATIGCSVVSDFVTLWTLALQASLFMEFPRQEYWSLLSCPTPGDLPNPGISCIPTRVSCIVSRFFTV